MRWNFSGMVNKFKSAYVKFLQNSMYRKLLKFANYYYYYYCYCTPCRGVYTSLSFCLLVFPLAYLKNRMSVLHEIFCTCYLWPWLDPSLMAMQGFHMIEQMCRNQRRRICFVHLLDGGTGGAKFAVSISILFSDGKYLFEI